VVERAAANGRAGANRRVAAGTVDRRGRGCELITGRGDTFQPQQIVAGAQRQRVSQAVGAAEGQLAHEGDLAVIVQCKTGIPRIERVIIKHASPRGRVSVDATLHRRIDRQPRSVKQDRFAAELESVQAVFGADTDGEDYRGRRDGQSSSISR